MKFPKLSEKEEEKIINEILDMRRYMKKYNHIRQALSDAILHTQETLEKKLKSASIQKLDEHLEG